MQIKEWFLDKCKHCIDAVVHKETVYSRDISFGAEIVHMKQGIDALRCLRYKLSMICIPISSPSYIYGDNMPVVHNAFRPESVLKKKSNSVCYQMVCESVAISESLVGHIPSKKNVADSMTKVLYGHKRRHLVSNILYDIHDDH